MNVFRSVQNWSPMCKHSWRKGNLQPCLLRAGIQGLEITMYSHWLAGRFFSNHFFSAAGERIFSILFSDLSLTLCKLFCCRYSCPHATKPLMATETDISPATPGVKTLADIWLTVLSELRCSNDRRSLSELPIGPAASTRQHIKQSLLPQVPNWKKLHRNSGLETKLN